MESVVNRISWFYKDGGLRSFGTCWHPNDFGAFLIWPLSISISLYFIDDSYKYKKYLLIIIGLLGFALLLSYSRGAWAGIFLSSCIIYFYGRKFIKLNYLLICLLLIGGLIGLKFVFSNIDIIPGNLTKRIISFGSAKKDTAMIPRFGRWEYFYKKSLERPLTGFSTVVGEAELKEFSGDAPTPHNSFLYLAVKRGYIALGIVVIIIIKFGLMSFRLFKKSEDKFIKALSLGIFSGLIGIFFVAGMFGSFFEDFQINILFWLFLAITAKLNIQVTRNSKTFRSEPKKI
jgi:hypothetical protein